MSNIGTEPDIHRTGHLSNPSGEMPHDQISDHACVYQGSAPPAAARTTFHSSEVSDFKTETKFERFFQIQHGLQPNRWNTLADEPAIKADRKHRINPERRFQMIKLQCISDIFSEPQRTDSINRVENLEQNDINRFTSHYRGFVGATLSARLTVAADRTDAMQPDDVDEWALFTDIIEPYAAQLGINNPSGLIGLARSVWSDVWEER